MIRGIVTLSVCVLLSLPGPSLRAEEVKVPLKDLPKAVKDAIKKQFPKAKAVSASKEFEDKKTLYEVTIKNGDQNVQVTATPEGEIVEVEKEIAAKDLPKAVTTALSEKYPSATIKKAEEVTKGKEMSYEVLLVTKDKKTLEVKFDSKGKVVKEEKKEK
jgi:uncharacterized membrane protein YkoI